MQQLIAVAIAGLVAQFVDGALGMGYGLTSSTLLIATGLTPSAASASVHPAEVGTTAISFSPSCAPRCCPAPERIRTAATAASRSPMRAGANPRQRRRPRGPSPSPRRSPISNKGITSRPILPAGRSIPPRDGVSVAGRGAITGSR